jgi:2-dehydropantoate 2-reductase
VDKNKKIAVIGTGANGSCTSADLVKNGFDVTLFDQWPAHVEMMKAHGLHISLGDEELHVSVDAHHLCELASLNRTFDVIFVVTKAYDALWATELAKPYLKEYGLLVALQNAMTAEAVRDIVGPSRTIGAVLEMSSEIFHPGIVRRNTSRKGTWFGVGSLDESTKGRAEEIQFLLSHVGKCDVLDNVLAGKWMKLIVNSMCLSSFALVGLKMAEAKELPGMREVIVQLGTEALDVGQKLGYKPEPIFGLKPEEIEGTNRFVELMFDKLAHDVGGRSLRNCSLQDLMKGRKSEVDLINGLVVNEGVRYGIDAPANKVIVDLTHEIEAGRLKPGPENMALILERLRA